MNRTPFKQLRQKFADDLEKIIECPVCLEELRGAVVQCLQGHHICIYCYTQLSDKICPLCKRRYHGTRNFLAENLATKFQEIKVSLAVPDHSINEAVVKDKMCIGTQTSPIVLKRKTTMQGVSPIANHSNQANAENIPKPVMTRLALMNKENYQNENKKIKECIQRDAFTGTSHNTADDIVIVESGIGSFPCLLGNCNELWRHYLLISHVREVHAECFVEAGVVKGSTYIHKWKLPYVPSKFNRAILIVNMGLFWIKIVISEELDVHGHVVLSNSHQKAQCFQYTFSIGKNSTFTSYEDKVLGSRKFVQNVSKGFLISSTSIAHLMKKPRTVECILKLTLK